MKKAILLIVLFSFSSSIAQDKYLIYFNDKGKLSNEMLYKSASKDIIAKENLTLRSIERRKKSLGENYFNYQDFPIDQSYIESLKVSGIEIVNKLKWFNAVSAYLTLSQINLISDLNFVEKIEPVRRLKSIKPMNEDLKSTKSLLKGSSNNEFNYGSSLTQNNLSEIPKIHNMGITGEGVIIGLLDTGYDWEQHISLKDRTVLAERDFIFKDNITANQPEQDVSFQHNHGTSVFSIIGGFDEGNLIGPAFNAQYVLAKTEFVPSETHVEEDNYAAALEWMDSIGVDITSSSLGYSEFDDSVFSYTYKDMDGKTTIVTKAAELAFERGMVVITSAGNEGNTSWKYITAPGDGFNTLTIGAVSSTNIVTSFSSEGPTFDGRIKPEIVAMGSGIINARASTTDGYGSGGGTSYSAPISAGIAGLLLSAHPHLTNTQIRNIMIRSGDNFENPDNERGYGLISAVKALTYPNLETLDGEYRLHKLFADSVLQNVSTIMVFFQKEGDDFIEVAELTKDEKKIYKYILPSLNLGQKIKFSFNLLDSAGNLIAREPEEGNYTWCFGEPISDILIEVESSEPIPAKHVLYQNYPNPFNSGTRIEYSLSEKSDVVIKVFDILGREIAKIVDDIKEKGNYSVDFTSKNLSSGVYFYQMKAGKFTQTQKLMLLK